MAFLRVERDSQMSRGLALKLAATALKFENMVKITDSVGSHVTGKWVATMPVEATTQAGLRSLTPRCSLHPGDQSLLP